MLPSSKFGGTCPPQGIFALQKSLRGGLRWGTGPSSQSGKSPAQRNFQRKFASRRVGSAKFVVPPTTERSKVRRHAQPVQPSVPGSPGCQRGRAPLFPKESRGNPFKGFLWAISSRRLDTALLCAAKKRGVESNQLAGFFQNQTGACRHRRQKQKAPLAGTARIIVSALAGLL